MNRYQNMLDRGYVPGQTYGSSPLCACGKKPEYLVRSFNDPSMLNHLCTEHYHLYRLTR